MRRREFIAGLGGAAAWPVVVRAQQPITPVIGYVSAGFPNTFPNLTLAFQQGLNESGFTEDKNVIVERRYGEGRFDRLPIVVAELARHHVDVIVLGSGPFPAVQSAAQGIPIVSVFGNDPMRGFGRQPESACRKCDRRRAVLIQSRRQAPRSVARGRSQGARHCDAHKRG